MYNIIYFDQHTRTHRDYTYKTAQTVYTATKQTISIYCNYNS